MYIPILVVDDTRLLKKEEVYGNGGNTGRHTHRRNRLITTKGKQGCVAMCVPMYEKWKLSLSPSLSLTCGRLPR